MKFTIDRCGLLKALTHVQSVVDRRKTIPILANVLLRANDRRVTIEEIQKKVAEHFNIRIADMHSARRARAIARPRQVAMYLAKQLTSRSLPEIGRKFGGRDHTTVMHACDKISALMKERSQIYNHVMALEKTVRAQAQSGDY